MAEVTFIESVSYLKNKWIEKTVNHYGIIKWNYLYDRTDK